MNNYNVSNSKFSKEFNMSSMEPKTLSYYQSRNMESMNWRNQGSAFIDKRQDSMQINEVPNFRQQLRREKPSLQYTTDYQARPLHRNALANGIDDIPMQPFSKALKNTPQNNNQRLAELQDTNKRQKLNETTDIEVTINKSPFKITKYHPQQRLQQPQNAESSSDSSNIEIISDYTSSNDIDDIGDNNRYSLEYSNVYDDDDDEKSSCTDYNWNDIEESKDNVVKKEESKGKTTAIKKRDK